jgi:membrane-bound metal-dependent hydrolase YbcI (DUF457 family)
LFVRFGIARLLMRYTVHRGMFHSIPALLIFTGLAFLICGSTNLHLRYFKAVGVFIGVLSHLALDEIYAVQWIGGRWRFKKSFGTALKLWSDSAWGNFSTYWKLAAVVVLILSEPAIMERYGTLSPIVVDNAALRERFHLQGTDPTTAPMLAHGAPANARERAAVQGEFSTGPTPGSSSSNWPDRTIYDTARRIWKRLAR